MKKLKKITSILNLKNEHKMLFNKAFEKISDLELFYAYKLIENTIKKNRKIFVAGNGGSAAVSNHFICDFLKNVKFFTKLKPKIISLSNNVEAIMAISNDISFDKSLEFQADSLAAKNDIFVIISSSGNSKNIKELINFATKKKNKIIGISAFDGGYVKKKSDIHIHVKTNDYGVSEDIFQSIMHIIVKMICLNNHN